MNYSVFKCLCINLLNENVFVIVVIKSESGSANITAKTPSDINIGKI